ncbi:MAG: GNAT family N-acetyltransferase [Clostridia bacterium]|nr:GNAT family N-acetyltransferase [Clostridia bacterium]
MNIAWLHDLFVSPDGRGRGIGKALVRTAVGKVPGRVWNYQAARDNVPYIRTAESCGFAYEGANLFVYSD